MQKVETELSVEDELAGFLGVLIKKLDDNKVELSQAGLIKRILEAMGIKGVNSKATPAEADAI